MPNPKQEIHQTCFSTNCPCRKGGECDGAYKPWPEQLKERFETRYDTFGGSFLWDKLGDQSVDEVIMEDFIQTVVIPQVREEMMKEVVACLPAEKDVRPEIEK